MRISKERWDKIKGRAKAHWGKHGQSYKASLYAGGTGVGGYYGQKAITQNVEFLRNNWWAGPAIMLLAGHFLAKKNPAIGHALTGAAGYAGALTYDLKKQAEANQQQAKGLDDAAAIADRVFDSAGEDAQALQDMAQAAALQEMTNAGELPEAIGAGAIYDAAATFDEVSALD